MSAQRGIDAQLSAIGSALLDTSLVPALLSELRETDFDPPFRDLYQAIRGLYNDNVPLDPTTLIDRAGQQHRELILQILELTPTASHFAAYVPIVRREAQLQQVRSLAGDMMASASLEELRLLHARIGDLLTGAQRRKPSTLAELMEDFVRRKTEGETYITSGMGMLDSRTYLSAGDLVILAGQPSRGKTVLALQLALQQSRHYKVGFFSLETNGAKLADRLVAQWSGVSMSSIKLARLTEAEWDTVGKTTAFLADPANCDLEIMEAAGMTVDEIFAVAKARKYQVIYVDYLQIISGEGRSRYEIVTNISTRLHTLAQQHKILTVALSQLSRNASQGKSEEPSMSDLRESGQIEQDADCILMLYCEHKDDVQGDRVLKIAKNKEGTTGKIKLEWDGSVQRLTPVSTRSDAPLPRMKRLNRSTPVPEEFEQQQIGGM